MSQSIITFTNVSKQYLKQRLRYGMLSDNVSHFFRHGSTSRQANDRNIVQALKHVSFTVPKGETLGIIGPNGAGKSTILKLICRVTIPDQGKITALGRIGALIELGAGLHPELTGRENIRLYGSILGMRKAEVEGKFKTIVKFAEIEKFLDMPIKRYSSGMYARLGFAVAVNLEPDILLIDEVLAVGDEHFQRKCFQKMKELRNRGTTIVFISHNLEWIKLICNQVIWLADGTIKKKGAARAVIAAYRQSI